MTRTHWRREPANSERVVISTLGNDMVVYMHGRYIDGQLYHVTAIAPAGLDVKPEAHEYTIGEHPVTILTLVCEGQAIGMEVIW